MIGCSTHGAAEATSAALNGADFVVVGTIWSTPSHPGREGAGLARIRASVEDASSPVVAIGGVTPDRARQARDAGAWGVAVIRGVWESQDPAAAAGEYLDALGEEA